MVYRWIELPDIHLQAISSWAGRSDEVHSPSTCGMNTLSCPAGIRVMDEQAAPNWLKDVHQGMLDHSVRIERQLVDDPLLRFVDHLLRVRRCGEGLFNQSVPDIENVLIQIIIEPADSILPALAFPGLFICQVDIIQLSYLIPKISVSLHDYFERSNVFLRY
jgi:hypothetical protein